MKRKKMTAFDLLNMECYFFEEHKVHRLDDKTIKGIRYTLDNRLTNEQKEIILSYKNTEIGTCYLKYANFNKGVEYSINQEIQQAEIEIKKRETKRKTQKNLETIDELKHKVAFLTSLLES